MRARLGRCFQHTRTQTLTRHFQQAETGDATHLNTCAVGFELVFQTFLDRRIVTALFHVDEVDDDETGQVAQTRLTGHFFGGFKVGLERGFLDRTFFRGATRVHIHRDKRLCHVDHDVTAGFELHSRVEHACEVAFHLIAREKRQLVGVMFHVLGMGRHDHFHEVLGLAIARFSFHKDLVDVLVIQVTDRAFDQVALFVDHRGSNRFQGQLADLFPHPFEIIVIAFDLGLGALRARRADDQASALRHFKLACDLFEFLAVCGIGDLARNAAATGGVRHQHTVTTGQRQVSGQSRALVAALFFHNLHQHDLTHFDDFLNLITTRTRLAFRAHFFVRIIVRNAFDAVITL